MPVHISSRLFSLPCLFFWSETCRGGAELFPLIPGPPPPGNIRTPAPGRPGVHPTASPSSLCWPARGRWVPCASHLCWPTSSPCVCVTRVCSMSSGPALSHMGRRGAGHSSLAPTGRPCSGIEAPGRLGQPSADSHTFPRCGSWGPGPQGEEARAPGPASPPEQQAQGQAGRTLWGWRLCPGCVPGGRSLHAWRTGGPGSISDGHLCLWQEKREVGGGRGEHVQDLLLLRQESVGSVVGGLRAHPRALAPAASRLSPPALPVCHTALLQRHPARALLGAAQARVRSIFNILMIGPVLCGRYRTVF